MSDPVAESERQRTEDRIYARFDPSSLPAGSRLKARYRLPKYKDGLLRLFYGKVPHDAPDIVVQRGEGCPKADGNFVMSEMAHILAELRRRGYDITTVKFSIELLPKGDCEI